MMATVVQHLEAAFGVPRRRRTQDPLDSLIQTILSQSTSDINSHRAFINLKKRFPTWEEVRAARRDRIARSIQIGGLANTKSVRIKAVLNEIKKRRGSMDLSFLKQVEIEEARNFLRSLDGVGPKTAACVLLFSCGRPVFPVDTHILRVSRRLGLIPQRCSDDRTHALLGSLIQPEKYYSAHINMIQLGRRICRPQRPKCEECPVMEYCEYGLRTGIGSHRRVGGERL